MAADKIPEATRQLIHEHIDAVEQLEVLLFLRNNAEQGWTADEVSSELRIQPASAANRMEMLHKSGFLHRVSGGTTATATAVCYRYEPAILSMQNAVDGLVLAYKERRHAVIDCIYAKPNEDLRIFSDAFRLRKDE